MSKNKGPMIPQTGNAPQPKPPAAMSQFQQVPETAPQESAELLVMMIGDHQRAIGELVTRLYNELVTRDRYIKSLPQQ